MTVYRITRTALSVAALTVLIAGVRPVAAHDFSNVIVFGDSNVDTGNEFAAEGTPLPPYYMGRISNGPVWVEELASQLSVPNPEASELGGTNYAWSGARTSTLLTPPGRLGTDAQINEYLASNTPDATQLIVIHGGGADLSPGVDPSLPVTNLSTQISALASAGAKNLAVANVIPIGTLPIFQGTSGREERTRRSEQFNNLLAAELYNLEWNLDISIYQVDIFGLVEGAIANPSSFGLTNVMDPAFVDVLGTVVPNPEEYLYWDGIHYTTAFHSILGQQVASAIEIPRPATFVASAEEIYAVIDDDSDGMHDDLGDATKDLSANNARSLGEVDTSTKNEVSRVIAKFDLPEPPADKPVLDSAALRFHLKNSEGTPAGPLSLWHSVGDNDLDQLASDYEDGSYTDTLLDLIQLTDPLDAYYELDVTDLVLADYASDGADPLSAFRLQINEAMFLEDDLSHRYALTMPGSFADPPQLVLAFIPEPSSLMLTLLGAVGLLGFTGRRRHACRRRGMPHEHSSLFSISEVIRHAPEGMLMLVSEFSNRSCSLRVCSFRSGEGRVMNVHRITQIAALAVLMVGTGHAISSEIKVVAPAGLENTDGNSFNESGAFASFRIQHLFLASDFPPLPPGKTKIIDVAARLDQQETSLITRNFQDLKITLSTTTAGDLGENLAQNFGADATVVFDGPATYTFPGTGPPDGPRPFATSTVRQIPFKYDPSEGRNLIVEYVSFAGVDATAILDWEETPSYLSGAFSEDAAGTEGVVFGVNFVQQFTFVPEPSAFTLTTLTLLGLVTCGWRRRRTR